MKNNFFPNKTVLCMIQPSPLPGSYRYENESFEKIIHDVLNEVSLVLENGFDGIIIQNMNDMPIKQISRPESIAYMTRIGVEIRKKYPKLVIGVLINWDGVASLAVADAIQADFVRVEHLYTGAEVTSAGILQAQCVDICELRKRIKSKIPIYVDIYESHGVPIGEKPIENAAWEAINEAFADGIFVSGKTSQESIEIVKKIKTKLPNIPVLLGGGATGDNIRELMNYYDGVSVATWIKNGNMKNPIDKDKARIFLNEAKQKTAC